MALRSKFRPLILQRHRLFSTSSLTTESKTLISSREKTRAALALIRSEQNPQRLLDICRSADLTPDAHLDRLAYTRVVMKLRASNHSEAIRGFIKDSMDKVRCKSERAVSHFIVLYGHGGLAADALNVFDEMPQMGIERNVKTLNSLLFACDLAGEHGEMKRIFSEFPRKYGLDPDLDTYNIVLKGYCNSGSSNEAFPILAEMERRNIKPNTTTFATVIAGFYAEEDFNSVGKMIELMKKYKMPTGMSIYNVRIKSLCKLNRLEEAKALFDGIVSRGMEPNAMTYTILIFGFCKEGKLETAKSLYEEMMYKGLEPGSECYFTLVYFLCQGRDFEDALNICKKCMSKGWVPNFTTMRSLVEGLLSIQKVDEAGRIIKQVKAKFPKDADNWKELEDKLP